MFALKFAGLFLLGAVVLWLLFTSAARASNRIRKRGKDSDADSDRK